MSFQGICLFCPVTALVTGEILLQVDERVPEIDTIAVIKEGIQIKKILFLLFQVLVRSCFIGASFKTAFELLPPISGCSAPVE